MSDQNTSPQRIGLHVSAAGGLEKAPDRAKELGAECFQFFSRSPRGGGAAPISKDTAEAFREKCQAYGFASYIHTPYYINFSSKNKRIWHGSVNVVREELQRGSQLGVEYVVTHMGSAKDFAKESSKKPALDLAVQGLKEIFQDNAPYKTKLLLEISAGAGSVVGHTFEELKYLLEGLGRTDVHICLDTCHMFASGYDVRTRQAWDQTLRVFDDVIGLTHLKLMHVNDSKTKLDKHVDRHEHLGQGFIGQAGFKAMLSHPKLKNINYVLETKHDKYLAADLELLKQVRQGEAWYNYLFFVYYPHFMSDKQQLLGQLNSRWIQIDLPLKDVATQAVPGEGNPNADIMFIGEAPGKNEDEQGRPFVGAAGKFLTELINTIDLTREDVFIANIIKHRPPNNRDPLPDEVIAYTPWLDEQIRIIDPKILVALGRYAMEYLLGPGYSISQIHGQPKRLPPGNKPASGRVVMPVYHPAAALYRHNWKPILAADFKKIPPIVELIRQGKDSTSTVPQEEVEQSTKQPTNEKQNPLL